MATPLLHPHTDASIKQFVARPAHAVLLIAPNGSGKGTVATYLAARLLGLDEAKLATSAYFKCLAAKPGKIISIDDVRDVTHFLTRRVTSGAATSRVVLIEHAGDMTPQAQNALLKTIEEPPEGTVLILTAASELDILPTVRSRVQILPLAPPDKEQIIAHFAGLGYTKSAIDKALLMSGGLIGLAQALLAKDSEHPLVAAAERARGLLQKTSFERLLMVDELTADKQAWLDTLTIIERISEINLQKTAGSAASKWHRILRAAHEAHEQTEASAQIKLVGLNFMLAL